MKTKNALVLANIGVLPLMTAFGGLNGDLLQYYASGYFAFSEAQVGLAIGLLVLTIPFQLVSTKFVSRWGCRKILLFGFGLRFLLIPLLLLVPGVLAMNVAMGEWLFYAIVFTVHLTHVCTFGVAWQPLVRSVTVPQERGAFFGKMRFMFHGYNFLFFGFIGVIIGKSISDADFFIIVLLLMAYCAFAFFMLFRIHEPTLGITNRVQAIGIFTSLKVLLKNPVYRALISINILRLPSSLPMFVVYLTLVIGLPASQIALIVALRAIGMMVGFIVWGWVIQTYGFAKAIQWSLTLLSATGGLWFLFALTPDQGYSASQSIMLIFLLIAALTAFLHCGLGLSLVTAVHNISKDDNAVVTLTLFDVVDMGLESVAVALAGIYIYTFFDTRTRAHTDIFFDPYMTLCLIGAVLCVISAAVGSRHLRPPQQRAN